MAGPFSWVEFFGQVFRRNETTALNNIPNLRGLNTFWMNNIQDVLRYPGVHGFNAPDTWYKGDVWTPHMLLLPHLPTPEGESVPGELAEL